MHPRDLLMCGGLTKREKNKAPRTKSIWSITGIGEPGVNPNLRLIKAPAKSPTRAPNDNTNPENGL